MYFKKKTYPQIYPSLWKDLELVKTFQINKNGVLKKKHNLFCGIFRGFDFAI